jgi:hypothetical protein
MTDSDFLNSAVKEIEQTTDFAVHKTIFAIKKMHENIENYVKNLKDDTIDEDEIFNKLINYDSNDREEVYKCAVVCSEALHLLCSDDAHSIFSNNDYERK